MLLKEGEEGGQKNGAAPMSSRGESRFGIDDGGSEGKRCHVTTQIFA